MKALHLSRRWLIRLTATLLLAFSAGANAAGSCTDNFKYILGVQLEENGLWMSIDSMSKLPVHHIGGVKTLMLSVERINSKWLLLGASVVTSEQTYTWSMQVEMDLHYPVKYSKVFRPAPLMPLFALELDPTCLAI